MSLIDTTYLVNEIFLPNGQNDYLQEDIDRYETEYLRMVFGFDLSVLVANYATSPEVIGHIAYGNDYTMDGKAVSWGGLFNEYKISPVAYYVFYKVCEAKHIRMMSTGAIKSKNENSEMATPYFKMVRAWNNMYDLTCGDVIGGRVNLATFLDDHKDIYEPYGYDPDFMFPIQRKNSFGI